MPVRSESLEQSPCRERKRQGDRIHRDGLLEALFAAQLISLWRAGQIGRASCRERVA